MEPEERRLYLGKNKALKNDARYLIMGNKDIQVDPYFKKLVIFQRKDASFYDKEQKTPFDYFNEGKELEIK